MPVKEHFTFPGSNKTKKLEKQISRESFIRIWQMSNSLSEVMRKTHLTTKQACHKARNLRRYGIALKKMPKEFIDFKRLREIADEYNKLYKENIQVKGEVEKR
mgnify:CR=1 FL=1